MIIDKLEEEDQVFLCSGRFNEKCEITAQRRSSSRFTNRHALTDVAYAQVSLLRRGSHSVFGQVEHQIVCACAGNLLSTRVEMVDLKSTNHADTEVHVAMAKLLLSAQVHQGSYSSGCIHHQMEIDFVTVAQMVQN